MQKVPQHEAQNREELFTKAMAFFGKALVDKLRLLPVGHGLGINFNVEVIGPDIRCVNGPRDRNTVEYKEWREAVYKRDNYTCRHCGQRGGRLQADHVLSWATHPALRFTLSNGQTLCVDCHAKKDSKYKHLILKSSYHRRAMLKADG